MHATPATTHAPLDIITSPHFSATPPDTPKSRVSFPSSAATQDPTPAPVVPCGDVMMRRRLTSV